MGAIASRCLLFPAKNLLFGDRRHPFGGLVQLRRVPPRTVSAELLLPFHHGGLTPVLRDLLGHAVSALAWSPRAFDAQHLKLALYVTKYEIAAGMSLPKFS